MKLLLSSLIGIAVFLGSAASAKIAPSFRGETLDGKKISLRESLDPNKALLISFWASWCVPCTEELRQVNAKLQADPALPLNVITVNVDTSETKGDIRSAMDSTFGSNFPVVLDPGHEIFGRYQQSKNLPYSVLVSPKGEIVATFAGYHEEMFAQIKSLVPGSVRAKLGKP